MSKDERIWVKYILMLQKKSKIKITDCGSCCRLAAIFNGITVLAVFISVLLNQDFNFQKR